MGTHARAASTDARSHRRRRAGVLVALAAAGALLVGCSASGSGGADTAADMPAAGELQGPVEEGAAADAGTGVLASTERQIVKNGELYLSVGDPLAAAARVATLVDDLDGRVDNREVYAGAEGTNGSATLTVRVPAASLDEAVERLGELGEVVRYTESTKDVTDVVVDLDARIAAAETSVDRVMEFLDEASNTTELLATERELSTRQGELESLRGQRQALRDQVSMSTLYVSLTAPGDAVIERPGPDTFVEGLGTGWHSLWATLKGLAVVLGVLLPWLALAAIVTLAVVVPLRLRRKATPTPPGTPPLVP